MDIVFGADGYDLNLFWRERLFLRYRVFGASWIVIELNQCIKVFMDEYRLVNAELYTRLLSLEFGKNPDFYIFKELDL